MVKIQVDLDETENKKLEIYKAKYSLKNKQEAIKKIVRELDIRI